MEASTTKMYLRTDPLEKRQALVNQTLDELLMDMRANGASEFHLKLYDGPLRQTLALIEEYRDEDPNDLIGGLVQTCVAMLSNPIYNICKDSMGGDKARPIELAVKVASTVASVMDKMSGAMSDAAFRSVQAELTAARQNATDEDCDCPACTAARAAMPRTDLQ